jgi:Ca-activated chloride channel family protein
MKTTLLLETHPAPTAELPGAVPGGHLVRALLRIEGEARPLDGRVPLNLSLVLDRSGSMQGGRLEAVKRAAAHLVRRLHPADRVSVVAFESEVATVAAPGTAAEQPGLLAALAALDTAGLTNLSGGWLAGRAHVDAHLDAEGVNRILLLTDGHANRGITDPDTLAGLCANARRSGVGTTTVGVGEGFDEDLLAAMADAGGGASYYVERLDQADDVFAEELDGLLGIAAQNLTVRLQPRDAVRVAEVHHSYPQDSAADDVLALRIGDLYAREPREVLVDLLVSPLHPAYTGAPVPVLDVVIEADVWTEDGGMERRRIAVPVSFDPAAGAVSNAEVTKVYTLLQAARARREARRFGDDGRTSAAIRTLREAARHMRAAGIEDVAVDAEAADLLHTAELLEDEEMLSIGNRKYIMSLERHAGRGRHSALRKGRRPARRD